LEENIKSLAESADGYIDVLFNNPDKNIYSFHGIVNIGKRDDNIKN
jgi:hypothetical protein